MGLLSEAMDKLVPAEAEQARNYMLYLMILALGYLRVHIHIWLPRDQDFQHQILKMQFGGDERSLGMARERHLIQEILGHKDSLCLLCEKPLESYHEPDQDAPENPNLLSAHSCPKTCLKCIWFLQQASGFGKRSQKVERWKNSGSMMLYMRQEKVAFIPQSLKEEI